ncbi:MAG: hypothetical protein GY909_13680 [Oligoflexia bacterium]|nr:hypothetical protein [Oligoflexia bacterium]
MKLKTLIASACTLASVASYAACPAGTSSLGTVDGKEACGLSGRYTSDVFLTSDKLWVLQGDVRIGNDNKENAAITILPGTKIVGQSGADFLLITRGSKIFAEGTEKAPIVFTGASSTNTARGQWGGLIINGNAPINKNGGEAEGEGNTGFYGGSDIADNSGVLKYVRVEYAGYEITPDNELNGIAFQGVGNGTVVDYIQVHKNADDGVEFFGGTVDVKHVVLTGNKDDSMDWTYGWTGRGQFIIIDQFSDKANNGIEADSSKIVDATPRSNPILSNMTFIGTEGESAKGGSAMLLRRGTGAEIYNSIFTGFKKGCIDIDDKQTADADMILFENNIVSCKKAFEAEAGETWSVADLFTAEYGNTIQDPMLEGYAPKAESPANIGDDVTPFDPFFTAVDYLGAVKDQNDTWYKSWTNSSRN